VRRRVSSRKISQSPITDLFARRVTGTDDALSTITALVSGLHHATVGRKTTASLERYFAERRIENLTFAPLSCDGFIQPLGSRFNDGFQIVINNSLPATRVRFTLAHELCHTFFYEYVPELKFTPHTPDRSEERLCNIGASELLMPRKSVMNDAREAQVCIKSLEDLARRYSVSAEAMLIRLRTLELWEAELSTWAPNVHGTLTCRKITGARKVAWNWLDDSLAQIWQTGQMKSGRTFIEYINARGSRRLRPICYEMQRRRDHILILWGIWEKKSAETRLPLFA
jgi:Zn-dependent peptidase ImmA (M78 family)